MVEGAVIAFGAGTAEIVVVTKLVGTGPTLDLLERGRIHSNRIVQPARTWVPRTSDRGMLL